MGATATAVPAGEGAFGPKLAVVTGGAVMTWLEPGGGDAHRVRFARFSGGAWSAASTIAEGASVFANWADVPVVGEAADGTLVATWPRRSGDGTYTYDVAVAVSRDGGATWADRGVAHDDGTETEHGFVSMVPTADGVRAFWLDGRQTGGHGHGHGEGTGAMTLRAAHLADAVTGGALIDPRVCDCCSTDATRASGGAVVAYRDRSDDDIRDIRVVREIAGGWSEPIVVHDDGWQVFGCPVNGPAIAADGELVAVAWFTLAGGRARVRLAFSDDGGASFAPPVDVDGARGTRVPIGRVDVSLAGADAIVSWVAADREDGGIYIRRVSPDGLVGDEVRVADTSPERSSGFPQLAVVSDDMLLVWTRPGEEAGLGTRVFAASSIPDARRSPAVQPEPETPPGLVGELAPDYAAERIASGGVTLAGLRGQPVLLNVWATWCEPCRHELPELDALRARFGDAGLRVVAVSVDGDAGAAELTDFMAKRGLGLEVWHDPTDRASSIFGITQLPATFLIDAEGRVVWRSVGLVRADDAALVEMIEQRLAAGR